MKIIITENQSEFIGSNFNSEDIEFVKAYKKDRGVYPQFRMLQQDDRTVGDIYPQHSKSNIKLKTFVNLYLKTDLSKIVALVSGGETIQPKQRGGGKVFVTRDYKHLLRSEFEVLAYNIFLYYNKQNEIKVDDPSFKKSCNKIPDFYWEPKNMIIEIAGMDSEKYKLNIINSIDCFKELGFDHKIIWSRKYEKSSKYKDFYIDFCNLVGLEIDDVVLKNPYEYIGNQNLDKEFMKKFIDDNVSIYGKSSNLNRVLNKYIHKLYGMSLKEYQKSMNIPRYEKSSDKEKIIDFKLKNPQMSNSEIGKVFGLSKNQVQRIVSLPISKSF